MDDELPDWTKDTDEEFQRLPFLTGSHAYGKPRPDSDVDIVVFWTNAQFYASKKVWPEIKTIGCGRAMLKTGQLNLIIFGNEEDYDAWKEVNDLLISRKPVTRDEAIVEFNKKGLTGGSGK